MIDFVAAQIPIVTFLVISIVEAIKQLAIARWPLDDEAIKNFAAFGAIVCGVLFNVLYVLIFYPSPDLRGAAQSGFVIGVAAAGGYKAILDVYRQFKTPKAGL